VRIARFFLSRKLFSGLVCLLPFREKT
jgi:hypothetical protein